MEEDREKEEGARKITIVREAFVKENLVKKSNTDHRCKTI